MNRRAQGVGLLDRLLDHDAWATSELLRTCRALSEPQLDQPFDIGHETVRSTLDHLVFVIRAWCAAIGGEPVGESARDGRSLDSLTVRHQEAHKAFARLARQLCDEGRLDETVLDDYGAQISRGGVIIHVLLHNAEHRSEILHMLVRLGVAEPPEIDHALWDILRLEP
jgi:uncharacterized damage-inducible protein DinB